jgi:hypothetical protein
MATTQRRRLLRTADLCRKVAPDTYDSAAALRAEEAASKGKHSEALPLFWQELRRAYALGDWNAEWLAHTRMAKECLRLGWLPQAYHHAMVARDNGAMKTIARAAIEYGRTDLITELIRCVLAEAHLLEHAGVSAQLLREVWDVTFQMKNFRPWWHGVWTCRGSLQQINSLRPQSEKSGGCALSFNTPHGSRVRKSGR